MARLLIFCMLAKNISRSLQACGQSSMVNFQNMELSITVQTRRFKIADPHMMCPMNTSHFAHKTNNNDDDDEHQSFCQLTNKR